MCQEQRTACSSKPTAFPIPIPYRLAIFFCRGHFQPMHTLNSPYPMLCQSSQTSHKCPYSLAILYMFMTPTTPTISKLAIVTALGWHPLIQTGKNASLLGMGIQKGEFSQLICAQKDRNSPPSANQGVFKAEPKDSDAVCTLQVHLPTSPCPALSAHSELMSKGHCRK